MRADVVRGVNLTFDVVQCEVKVAALTPRTLSASTEDRLATVIQCSEAVIGPSLRYLA
jgi:hypothetical protein